MPRQWSIFTGGGGSSSSNSFTIMQPITGTAPTATSSTDTLTFTSSDGTISIIGNSATDTLDFKATAAAGANTALSNLASVAINLSLTPGTDDSINLGSLTKQWKNLYMSAAGILIKNNDNFLLAPGTDNVFLGKKAGNITLSGSSNVGIGSLALQFVSSGSSNMAIGSAALNQLTTGSFNTVVGDSATNTLQGGSSNTCIGSSAAHLLLSGGENTVIGRQALQTCSTGSRNTCVGTFAGFTITGSDCTFIGKSAGENSSTGIQNTSVGGSAIQANCTGNNNAALGYQALTAVTSGASNAAFGAQSLSAVLGGGSNCALGKSAGDTVTSGGSNICLGVSSNPQTATSSNQFCVGSNASSIVDMFIGKGGVGLAAASLITTTIQTTPATGTDISATNSILRIAGSRGTGTGLPGDVRMAFADPGSTGSSLNTLNDYYIWNYLCYENKRAIALQPQYDQPATGVTVTIANTTSVEIVDPAAGIAALTVNFPSTPKNGQIIYMTFTQTIAALTMSAGANTIQAPLLAIASANSFATWVYRTTSTTWFRIS